ncbi:hypothetical protein AQ611_07640 [Burkholderia singularis]|nr:hypothetical protein AQ611_07640 [Burkholderia sp. Bp7605]
MRIRADAEACRACERRTRGIRARAPGRMPKRPSARRRHETATATLASARVIETGQTPNAPPFPAHGFVCALQ